MQLVTTRHLHQEAAEYPDAASELPDWALLVPAARWTYFAEVKLSIAVADAVRGYVIFNIRHNRYRLVTVIHYAREREGRLTMGRVYVRSLLTHKQYDNPETWDKEYGA